MIKYGVNRMSITKTASELKKEQQQEQESLNLFLSTQTVIQEALQKLGYGEEVYHLLKEPLRMMTVRIPVKMDNGSVKSSPATALSIMMLSGLLKEGVRFHPEVNEEEVKALSIWMSLKCGIVDLPYGGGKGGIVCDPRNMSFGELERLSRGCKSHQSNSWAY